MILERFYDSKLAQASFLVGCGETREAIVIDPNRDSGQYLEAAAAQGLRITKVTETHIHADYASGSRELAAQTGATMYLSDEGTEDWKYEFPAQDDVVKIKDGDAIRVGRVRLDAVATPGHTPEHVTFVLTDEAASSAPLGAFTGDFIFVGDVGRPDLLERAAGFEGTMEKGARVLYQSLVRFKERFANEMILWPSHGSGSACGKSLGGVPVSTLGYEKKTNAGLRCSSEQEFVDYVLSGQPEPPVYFRQMKHINKVGPAILNGISTPARLAGAKVLELLGEHNSIVDIRATGEVSLGFIPGTLAISQGKSFTNWSGWLLSYGKPIYLLANDERSVREAVRDLAMVGLDDVRGWMGPDAFAAYEARHGVLHSFHNVSAREAAEAGSSQILDLRGLSEWEEGHVPGACHIPLGYLASRSDELDRDRPVIVHCGGGTRSAIGVSVLSSLGFKQIQHMPGGMWEYRLSGLPIERGA